MSKETCGFIGAKRLHSRQNCLDRQIVLHVVVLLLTCQVSKHLLAADLIFYSVGKGQYFNQTSGGSPVLKQPRPWLGEARLVVESNSVNDVMLKLPQSLFPWYIAHRWYQEGSSTTQAQQDTGWPNGEYRFQVYTKHDGLINVTNQMISGSFPNAPTVNNFPAAQAIDASSDFSLTWDSFVGGTLADLIYCQLQTVGAAVFHTPMVPGSAGALDGTATSVTIPAGTLAPARAYLGRLVFARTLTTSSNLNYPAFGATFAFTQTEFWIRTQGEGDSTPPYDLL